MALDKEFFDSINIEVVRKKYYNANKVNAVFEQIRREAEQLTAENEMLRSSAGSKDELADVLLSARIISQKIIEDANAEADALLRHSREESERMLADAKAESQRMLDTASKRQEQSIAAIAHCVNNIKKQQEASMEALNSEWQEFLCSLEDDYAPDDVQAVPADLKAKVSSLAQELFSLDD